jgi:alpha-beta hydrolase superfamily lysophospholipase
MRPTLFKHSFLLLLLLPACAVPGATPEAATEDLRLPLIRTDIDIPTPHGTIHTEAVWRLGANLRSDRHVVLLVPGTLANGAGYYDIARGTGFNASEVLAREGFIVGLIDLPGTGESYRPADGSTLDSEFYAQAVRRVALAYRLGFWVPSVSIYGETGVGTNVGLLLARETGVRSFVGSALFYREFGPAVATTLFDPGFRAGVGAVPGGYVPQDPMFLGAFFGAASPAIQAEAVSACLGPAPGTTPTGALLELFDVNYATTSGPFGPAFVLDAPIVDAAPARADALFIQGSPDFIGSENGTNEMAAAYGSTGGGEAEVVVLPGASHLMRFDATISDGPSSAFWSEVVAFLHAH